MPTELLLVADDQVFPVTMQIAPIAEQGFLEAIRVWQQGIAALIGFAGLIGAALYNFHLNRTRDRDLREEEVNAVCSGLYGEILILRRALARIARIIAKAKMDGRELDKHFFADNQLPKPVLFDALAEKVGLIPPSMTTSIIAFMAGTMLAKEI
jgi:hypothetical protein